MLRRLPLFNMTFLLISSMACFSLGLLLNVVLLYRDVYPKRTDESRVRLGVGERVLSAVFGAVQAVLSMAGIAAVVLALLSKSDMYWGRYGCTMQPPFSDRHKCKKTKANPPDSPTHRTTSSAGSYVSLHISLGLYGLRIWLLS